MPGQTESGELPDDRAQREEVEDDCAGAVASLQERNDHLEQLLLLMTTRFLEQTDLTGAGDLCSDCKRIYRCGPDKDEPCDEFTAADERFVELAPVREHLDEMTRGGRR